VAERWAAGGAALSPSIYIGYDSREAEAFSVARASVQERLTMPIPIMGLVLRSLRNRGLYYRPTELRPSAADKPVLWDVISEAPMATEFAISRFLVPTLAQRGWALFMDCDMMALTNFARLFDGLDRSKAVYCVKHRHAEGPKTKMDGQLQTFYVRKNWSSFMVMNCDHPSNKLLTVEAVNTLPGRDLHRFCWLKDDEIGELDPAWNFLVGHSDPSIQPKNIHWTTGGPWFREYEDVPYAEEWRDARDKAVA
jgi:hypothetical protein